MTEWFETLDDLLWLKPDDIGREEARFIGKILRLRRGHTVLDAPCGAGRISIHLARAGCAVTGIDLRRTFIRRARQRFLKAHLSGTFLAMDIRELDFEKRFHSIFNWFGSFGYFSDSENDRLVNSYARALQPGGRLILEQSNRERILRHFIAVRRTGNMIIRNRWDAASERLISRRIVNGKNDPRNLSSMRLYTPAQMKRLLKRNGLKMEKIYGSHLGDRFTKSSPRMIVLAKKE